MTIGFDKELLESKWWTPTLATECDVAAAPTSSVQSCPLQRWRAKQKCNKCFQMVTHRTFILSEGWNLCTAINVPHCGDEFDCYFFFQIVADILSLQKKIQSLVTGQKFQCQKACDYGPTMLHWQWLPGATTHYPAVRHSYSLILLLTTCMSVLAGRTTREEEVQVVADWLID